ncbi:MAG: hypothetical protein LBE80_03885 [Deltaproteobacteria bacterium]|nr:hypothetical protein [Deltaproteobacteria bacterium]
MACQAGADQQVEAAGLESLGAIESPGALGAWAVNLSPQWFSTSGLASREVRLEALFPGGSLAGGRFEFYWHESQSSLASPEPPKGQYVVVKGHFSEPLAQVTVGGYSRVEFTAKIRAEDGTEHYAQADFDIYAREGSSSPVSQDLPPKWPFFELKSDQPLYWPQTGQTFFISLKNFDAKPVPLSVWEGGGQSPVALLWPDSEGLFTYVPPNDPELDKLGTTATKRIVFTRPLAEGGTASLSLYLHRSRAEKRNLPVGLGVFGLSLTASAWAFFLVIARGRPKPCP